MREKTEELWLLDQISSAKESLEDWPQWMREEAKFEGTDNDHVTKYKRDLKDSAMSRVKASE